MPDNDPNPVNPGESKDKPNDAPGATAIAAAVDAAVSGLKAKNNEVIGENKKLKERLAQFDGIDPVAVRAILKRFSDDEEARLIAEGKIDDVLSRRTDRMKADYEQKLKAEHERAEASARKAQAFQGRVLDDAIRAAASKAGLHQQAIDDALFRGRALFTLDEGGNAVQLGEDGHPVPGKDGKTPFAPLEWLEGMKEKAPHWFPAAASGSGSHGGTAGGSLPPNADWKKAGTKERVAILKAKHPELGKE